MSGRKRKSLWDCKEETEVPSEFSTHNARYGRGTHSNHRAQRSDLEATNALNSNSCLRRSSSQTWQDNNEHRDFNEIPETARTISGGKGYSQSPVFNGHGRQNHSPSQETSWGQSHRYQRRSRSSSRSRGRARSWSRDRDMDEDKDYTRRRDRDVDEDRDYTRSRDRDMDEDREYNQSRDRDMDEDRDYARSRGRGRDIDDDSDYPRSWERERNKDMDEDRNFTRSRGRDRDINNDSARSRSTLYDHRRLDGIGDRKSGSRVPSQLCRDFAVGNCRRGSQCRFLHEDDLKLRDGGELAERAEKWRGRQEAGEALSADIERLRYHPANKVSNYDRSNRSTSFDHDHMRRPNQPYKKGNIPCKYFAIGRCHRDDCRFSHDQSEGGSVEGRLHYDRYARHMGNENKYRNGPELGDGNVVPNVNITKWSDNDVRTVNYTDRKTAKKQTCDSSDQNMNHENKSWNGPGWGDVNGVSDLASARWVENNAGSVDFSEAAVVEIKTDERHGNNLDYMMQNTTENGSNIADVETFELTGAASSFGREVRHNSQGSHFRSQNGMSLQTYEHIIDRAPTQQLTGNVGHPVVSGSFDVQQHNNKGGNNDMLADDSNAVNGVSISGSTMHLGVPDQRFGQKTESLGSLLFSSADTTQKNTIPLNPSRGYGIDPNGSDKQSLYLSPQNPQADSGIHQSLHQNDMTSYQVTEMTNLSASLNEILSKGQQLPELYAALNPNNSSRLLSSLSSSAIVSSPIGSTAGQHNPTTMFEEQYVHIGDTVEPSKYNKRGKPDYLASVLPSSTEDPGKHDSNSKPYELDKSMTSEHLLLLSNDGISEHGNNNKPDELHEPEQMKPITNSESQENYSMQGEKCKPEDEIHLANPEGDVRDGICVKDEKEMRLFKVALVEYVKDILKPTWKEGHMSREVHKTIVKKVVDKVTSTIQGGHVPKTQEKIDQYLACSKGKLTKLVQAYTERLSKS